MDPYSRALSKINRVADRPEGFSGPFLELIPASGAAVSTIGEFLGNETLSSTSPQAARVDELQFDLGEGPCWDAMRSARPVLRPDVASAAELWPAFTDAMVVEKIHSIYAFPLLVGSLRIGAVDIYSHQPLVLSETQARDASALAGVTGRYVLRHALENIQGEVEGPEAITRGFPRRVVHQATGMVMAQLGLSADDATLVIQGHAFAASRSVMETAQAIVERELDISDPDQTGEGPV